MGGALPATGRVDGENLPPISSKMYCRLKATNGESTPNSIPESLLKSYFRLLAGVTFRKVGPAVACVATEGLWRVLAGARCSKGFRPLAGATFRK